MNITSTIIGLVIILALIFGGWYAYSHYWVASHLQNGTAMVPASTTPSIAEVSIGTGTTTTTTPASITTITYTNSGFSPSTFTIALGTTVHFVNDSSHGMWVAVGQHPTHTDYDGTTEQQHCTNGVDNNGSFDECSPIAPGGVYSFTFNKVGTFPFHNHVAEGDTGTVTIQ